MMRSWLLPMVSALAGMSGVYLAQAWMNESFTRHQLWVSGAVFSALSLALLAFIDVVYP